MIVSCPSCSTRFVVDPSALGEAGRRVRCARCQHVWFQERPADAVSIPPPPAPPSASEPAAAPRRAGPLPPSANLPARPEDVARRPAGSAAAWVLLAAVIGAIVALGYVGRHDVVRLWPPALALYDGLGIDMAGLDPVEDLGVSPGLVVRPDLESEIVPSPAGDTLRIRGHIDNVSEVPRVVPPLEVELSDAEDNALHRWVFRPEADRLEPGESVPFETSFTGADTEVARLEIRVAAER